MSEPGVLRIHTDGAARGNPGPAAFAYVIDQDGAEPIQEAGCLGRMTNNQAEYTALVRALEHAARLGVEHRLLIHSDSELLVKQMNGEYRVKDDSLRALYEQAQKLRDRFAGVTIRHIRRAQNSEADRLCNEALDGLRSPTPVASDFAPTPVEQSPPAEPGPSRQQRAREKTLARLRTAAAAWARGNAADPAPEMVCHEIWNILEETGVLRQPRPR
jgi:ribonuclease HI